MTPADKTPPSPHPHSPLQRFWGFVSTVLAIVFFATLLRLILG